MSTFVKRTCAFTLLASTMAIASAHADSDAPHKHDGDLDGRDPIVLSFCTVGDSRQDLKHPDPTAPLTNQDSIWLQNSRDFSQILRNIEWQSPNFLFFNGDMIMGYGNTEFPAVATTVEDLVGSDLVTEYRQYAFWRGMVANLMETGTYVVPVPGNHETQWKAGGKVALVANENAWRANMGDLILDDSRFDTLFGEIPSYENTTNNGVMDGLSSDQSQLSYSFDFRGSHFAIINTDPVGNDAHAPVNWLADDLAKARARGAEHFFVFGHKPAFTYYYGVNNTLPDGPAGLDKDIARRDAFWNVIEQYGATYFCGHEHIYHMDQPRADEGGKAWQVLVGSGGSPFEALPEDITLSPTDRYYAWANVAVHKSGKVIITAYGFNDQGGPVRMLKRIVLK